ncbi:MAG: GAF domain-containing protein [Hydrogenophaga sp.]|nr:GAF domain-containing protein [Hydrogenophaga sp.]
MKPASLSPLLLSALLSLGSSAAWADLPPAVQSKTDSYKAKLVEWAANPTIVAAVKEANAKGPAGGMNNGKWNDLDEKDPVVTAYQTSAAGNMISKWEGDKNLSKLVLRDEKGNLVAASLKPVVFNNAARPPFANAIKGAAWAANEVKPDPASGVKGVHVSAPVLDGGKVIGVLHTSVTAD